MADDASTQGAVPGIADTQAPEHAGEDQGWTPLVPAAAFGGIFQR